MKFSKIKIRINKYVLVAIAGLVFGLGGAFFMNKKPALSKQSIEKNEPLQTYQSENGDVTQPDKTNVDLAPKALKFTSSNYSVIEGETVYMRISLVDGNAVQASSLGPVTVKISGAGANHSVNIPTSKSDFTILFKPLSGAGTYDITASAQGLSNATASLVINPKVSEYGYGTTRD